MASKRKADNRARGKARRFRAKEAGNCVDCGRNPVQRKLSRCRMCALKLLAHRHLGSRRRAPELEQLLITQIGRCAYSGRQIDIGKNASIEHIEPQSRNARRKDDISNIRWVDTRINKMKHDLSLHDFLMACKDVLRFFGYEVKGDGR